MSRLVVALGLGATLVAGLLGACSDPPLYGPPTASVCPPDSTLTYTNFGKQFMDSYCVQCHASDLHGSARHGAPAFHDFDTLRGVKQVREHIDETTAAGPASTNRGMPEDDPSPSDEERRMLGEWLACDVPE